MIRRSDRRSAPAVRPLRPAALRPGARPGGGVRRTRPVRRASAGLTPVRAGALLVLLAAVAALYGLASSDAFTARRSVVTGATWTPDAAILAALDLPPGQNLFTLRTADLEGRAAGLPAIRGASVTVALPDELRVAVDERRALLAWRVGERAFLVDGEGRLFGALGEDPPPAADALPGVDDRRTAARDLGVGSVLDAVTLDAALRLGSLSPADVGSAAPAMSIRVDDTDGFSLRPESGGWTAVFGFYTPTLRTTELIPGQVRLLAGLLAGREDRVLRVMLADEDTGTYVPRPTAAPSASPRR